MILKFSVKWERYPPHHGFFQGLNELMGTKCLLHCLAHSKNSVSSYSYYSLAQLESSDQLLCLQYCSLFPPSQCQQNSLKYLSSFPNSSITDLCLHKAKSSLLVSHLSLSLLSAPASFPRFCQDILHTAPEYITLFPVSVPLGTFHLLSVQEIHLYLSKLKEHPLLSFSQSIQTEISTDSEGFIYCCCNHFLICLSPSLAQENCESKDYVIQSYMSYIPSMKHTSWSWQAFTNY